MQSYGYVSAWGRDRAEERPSILNPIGHAWQLDRSAFEEMLLSAAADVGAEVRRGCTVEKISRDGHRWCLQHRQNATTTDWLIDATGRRSLVGRLLGVKRLVLDKLVAIHSIAVSHTGSDQDSRTWTESSPDGWWYSALTPGGRRTVSFQTDADLLSGQECRTQEWFAKRLGQTRHISALLDGHGYEFSGAPR